MRAITIPTNTPEDWLRARRAGLGGSEISALAGLNPWMSAFDLWLLKCGLAEPQPQTPIMKVGLKLEPAIAELYSEETGLELETCPLMRHETIPFIQGSPDRLVKGQPKGVELKTSRLSHGW